MKNRSPAYLWVSIFSAVLLFLVLVVNIVRDDRFYFNSIDSAVLDGNVIWGIDSDGEDETVFCVSEATGIGRFIKVPLLEGERIVTITDPFISDGQVYFHKTLYSSDGSFSEQLVFWNLEKDRLENTEKKETDIKSEDSRTEFAYGWVETVGSDYDVMEVDPPEDSELEKKGKMQLCVRRNGETRLLDYVQREPGTTFRRIVIAFLGAVLLFIALFLLGSFSAYYHIYPGIWIRLGLLILAMMYILVTVFVNHLRLDLYNYVERNILYYCADSAYIRIPAINQELLERFMNEEEIFSPGRMPDLWKYDLIKSSVDEDTQHGIAIYQSDHKRAWDLYDDSVVTEENSIIFKKDESLGVFYDDLAAEIPWLTDYQPAQRKYIDRAFATGKIQKFITATGRQRYAVAFVPVDIGAHTRVLVGTRAPLNNILILFTEVRVRSMRIFMVLGGILLVVCIAGAIQALWPIRALMEAVKAITAGNLKARARSRGFNELHYLARLFNVMADRLEAQSKGAVTYQHFYDAFLPASLLRRMSGRSVAGALHSNAVYRTNACCLVIDAQGDDPSEEKRNNLYSTAIRTSAEYGGHPTEFDDKKIKLICTDGTEAAFRAVTSLQQELMTAQKSCAWAGMASCPVRLSVIGSDVRKNVIEQDSQEAEVLCEIAADLRIPVILTEELYLDVIRSTTKLHFRCLGRIGKDGYTPAEPLYELLDANTAAAKAVREYSRTEFEQGANAYAAGDYFTARNEMIKVLEMNPDDLAARCYILNCDRKEPPKVCQAMKKAN